MFWCIVLIIGISRGTILYFSSINDILGNGSFQNPYKFFNLSVDFLKDDKNKPNSLIFLSDNEFFGLENSSFGLFDFTEGLKYNNSRI